MITPVSVQEPAEASPAVASYHHFPWELVQSCLRLQGHASIHLEHSACNFACLVTCTMPTCKFCTFKTSSHPETRHDCCIPVCCAVEGLGFRDVVVILQGRRCDGFPGSSVIFVESCLRACGILGALHARLVKAGLVRKYAQQNSQGSDHVVLLTALVLVCYIVCYKKLRPSVRDAGTCWARHGTTAVC